MPRGEAERGYRTSQEIDPKKLIDRGIAQLLSELQQGKSERLERYLAFTARLHHYSPYNQMLIYRQMPQATYVAGYAKWQEMGYQVARGAKGIRILAPRPYTKVNEETQEEEQAIWFKTVSVFDASQLDLKGKPLPTFFTPLSDDQQELYRRLAQVVNDDGIAIVDNPTGLAQGYSDGGLIAVQTGLDSTNKFLMLIHEYAHELLHKTGEGRGQSQQVKECHAEAISYVVAHHFGIHNPFSKRLSSTLGQHLKRNCWQS